MWTFLHETTNGQVGDLLTLGAGDCFSTLLTFFTDQGVGHFMDMTAVFHLIDLSTRGSSIGGSGDFRDKFGLGLATTLAWPRPPDSDSHPASPDRPRRSGERTVALSVLGAPLAPAVVPDGLVASLASSRSDRRSAPGSPGIRASVRWMDPP